MRVHNLIMEIYFVLNENLKRNLSWDKESLPLGAVKIYPVLLCVTPYGLLDVCVCAWVVETDYLKVEDSFLADAGKSLKS